MIRLAVGYQLRAMALLSDAHGPALPCMNDHPQCLLLCIAILNLMGPVP